MVYARVCEASRDLDPEISCVDPVGRAMGYGVLKGGTVVECSTGLARRLLSRPPAPVLMELGRAVPFEIAVGMNGRVWINAPKPRTVGIVGAVIRAAETHSDAQLASLVGRLVAAAAQEERDAAVDADE